MVEKSTAMTINVLLILIINVSLLMGGILL